MAFSLGGMWDGSWSGASDVGLGNWGTIGKSNSGGSSMFDPISLGIYGLGQIGNALFTGSTNSRLAAQQKKDHQQQALYGMFGTMTSAAQDRAARAEASAASTLGQFGGVLYGDPITAGLQERVERQRVGVFEPIRLAAQRAEGRLAKEEGMTPLSRGLFQDEARQNRLAGAYATALPDMVKWGKFNLPTT